jgi:type IV fimbrial biogenesis protein FimT
MKSKTPRRQGLTLIELLMVLAVLSITLGQSAPSFKAMLQKRRLEAASSDVVADLQYARSEAVARNRTVRIVFEQHDTGSCYVIHAGGTCHCAADGTASCSPNAGLIKSFGLSASSGLTLTSNAAFITLDPVLGTFSPTATLNLTSTGGIGIRHVVNLLGRVRSCSPGRTVTGYAAC